MENKIKIYVSCHKESYVSKNKFLYPIQVGAALAPKHFENMLHDDEGDNISNKNRSYCELTAQYWVWKHEDADYYGFFHYRRYLSFSNDALPADIVENVIFDFIDSETEKKIGLEEENMEYVISNEDVIIPEPYNISEMGYKNVYYQYKTADSQYSKDLDLSIKVLKEKYPEFSQCCDEYMKSETAYICNMFIMKKEIFHNYNKWLFDILEEVEKQANFDHYSDYAFRVIGFISERLLGVYITYLKKQNKYKIRELQKTLFLNTDKQEDLLPAFENVNIPIILSCSNEYVSKLCVLVKSIETNSSLEYNYDIIILEKELTIENKNIIKSIIEGVKNLSVRFVNVKHFVHENFEETYRGQVSEPLFAIIAPYILHNYKKAIYLEADLVVMKDLSKLYNIEIYDNYIGACRDIDIIASYNTKENHYIEYLDKVIQIEDPYSYVQTGMMLMNLDKIRTNVKLSNLKKYLKENKFINFKKDYINMTSQKKISIIDMQWNVIVNDIAMNHDIFRKNVFWNLPRELSTEYKTVKDKPSIIHYSGSIKPWHNPDSEYAYIYWNYARQCHNYESVLLDMIKNQVSQVTGKLASMEVNNDSNKPSKLSRISRKIMPEKMVMALWRLKNRLLS